MKSTVPPQDLDEIISQTKQLWPMFRDQAIFITGGTGFMGKWLLETFAHANAVFDLNLSVTVLTRDPVQFQKKYPRLFCQPMFAFLQGDVRNFVFPDKRFSYVIHAATEASAKLNHEQPDVMLDTILQGTRHTLAFAKYAKAKRFLYVSSGAVYGKQAYDIKHVEEDCLGESRHYKAHSIYGVGKLAAEYLCTLCANDFDCSIARCFSFVGPHLPLEAHFAIGNFIRDGLVGGEIVVNSDGSTIRSYLYATDLVIWLLHVLCLGEKNKAYNIGSDESVSIAELAKLVAGSFAPQPLVNIKKATREVELPDIYVPSIQRAAEKLALSVRVKLPEAIWRTIEWYRQ